MEISKGLPTKSDNDDDILILLRLKTTKWQKRNANNRLKFKEQWMNYDHYMYVWKTTNSFYLSVSRSLNIFFLKKRFTIDWQTLLGWYQYDFWLTLPGYTLWMTLIAISLTLKSFINYILSILFFIVGANFKFYLKKQQNHQWIECKNTHVFWYFIGNKGWYWVCLIISTKAVEAKGFWGRLFKNLRHSKFPGKIWTDKVIIYTLLFLSFQRWITWTEFVCVCDKTIYRWNR